MLGKSDVENAEFLRKEFKTDGRGYIMPDGTHLSAWFDKDGITLGVGETAFNIVTKERISWEQASQHINKLLENGEYCVQDEIDLSVGNEVKDLAEKLWFIHQDIDRESGVEYFIPEEKFKGGFPESHKRIMADLADPETLKKYISGMEDFIRKYEENRDILRFHFHRPKEALSRMRDLQIQRKEFITKPDFRFEPAFFVTEDEKEDILLHHYGYRDGKFSIAKFFEQNDDEKERIKFLKKQYGEGGSSHLGFSVSYSAKGIRCVKSDLDFGTTAYNAEMKWDEIASRIERLIADGKYIMGETLEAIFQKFNIDRPKDFKGHSLSVSDVVVVGRDAYYVDKAGYKPLHDFMRETIDRDRSVQENGSRKEIEPKQDKPETPEKQTEYHKRKSR